MNVSPPHRARIESRKEANGPYLRGIIWDFFAPPPPSHATLTLVLQESMVSDLRLKNHEQFKTILAKFQLSMSYRFRDTAVQSRKIPLSSACCQSANNVIQIIF